MKTSWSLHTCRGPAVRSPEGNKSTLRKQRANLGMKLFLNPRLQIIGAPLSCAITAVDANNLLNELNLICIFIRDIEEICKHWFLQFDGVTIFRVCN